MCKYLLGFFNSSTKKFKLYLENINTITISTDHWYNNIYFLKQLKRAGAGTGDLLCFYNTIVRPVLEYASPVWHSSLTAGQCEALESLQKRAMSIIFPHLDYSGSLFIAKAGTLEDRSESYALLESAVTLSHVAIETMC